MPATWPMSQLLGNGFGQNASTWNCGTELVPLASLAAWAFASSGERRAGGEQETDDLHCYPPQCSGSGSARSVSGKAPSPCRFNLTSPDLPVLPVGPDGLPGASFPPSAVVLYSLEHDPEKLQTFRNRRFGYSPMLLVHTTCRSALLRPRVPGSREHGSGHRRGRDDGSDSPWCGQRQRSRSGISGNP